MTAPEWPRVPLGEICTFQNGGTPSKSVSRYFDGEIPWLTGADITGPVAGRCRTYISEAGISASPACVVPKGAVLLVTRTGVGKVAVADRALSFSQDITALLPDGSRVHTPFLLHFLITQAERFKRASRGATIKGITRQVVASTLVPLPPIEEQRRVAAILNKADQVRANRRSTLEMGATLSQAIFVQMFGDPVTNPKEWPVSDLYEAVTLVQIGPFGSLLHQKDYIEGGVPVINPMHIVDGSILPDPRHTVPTDAIRRLHNYVLHKGDVVMGRRGEMGRCAVVSEDEDGMLCGSGSLIIRPNATRTTSLYLWALMSSPFMKRHLEHQALGVTMANLNSSIIEKLAIPIPGLALQEHFDQLLGKYSTMARASITSDHSLGDLFVSLQRRAFQGAL